MNNLPNKLVRSNERHKSGLREYWQISVKH